jgi:hypothetical protein
MSIPAPTESPWLPQQQPGADPTVIPAQVLWRLRSRRRLPPVVNPVGNHYAADQIAAPTPVLELELSDEPHSR